MWSGWTGPGPKTIIPARAGAKLSSRLVADQDPHKVYEQLQSYIESIAPATVSVDVRLLTTGEPALIPFDLPEMQAAAHAYERDGVRRRYSRAAAAASLLSPTFAI